MKFTINQQKAIDLRGQSILVSAGAGSGKTAVLKTRVQKLVLEGIDIDNLLILTFTNAAALEMKGRIAKALKESGQQKQLEKIDTAYITTFDAFFLDLVKKYYYLLGINKKIIIADYTIIKREKLKIVNAIFKERFTNDNQKFLDLLNDYTVFDEQDLIDKIIFLYDNKLNIFQGDQYLNGYIDCEILFKQYETFLLNQLNTIKNLVKQIKPLIIEQKEEDYVQKVEQYLYLLIHANSYNDFYDFFQEVKTFPRFTLKSDNKEQIKSIVDSIKEGLADLKNYVLEPKEIVLLNLKESLPAAEEIMDILKQLESKLLSFKKEYGMYEFNDITNFAIKLVETSPEVKNELKSKFFEIMVDEYQDTNDFQNYFISLIANDNVYMVGDVKQSIYGFRHANPQNFTDIEASYQKTGVGSVINLMDNFRSRDEVLYGLNTIFSAIMSAEIGGVVYNEDQKLKYGNKQYELKQEDQSYEFEVIKYSIEEVKELELSQKYIEPYLIAKDIANKVAQKYQILDFEQGLRDCQYSDFCILTRTKTHYTYYVQMLEYMNIVVQSQKEPEFKTKDIIIFYKSIFNYLYGPDNKILNLLSIFRSFVCSIDDLEIENYIINGIVTPLIQDVISKLTEIKSLGLTSIAMVFDNIYEIFNINNYLSIMPEAKGVFNQLDSFKKVCLSFDQVNYSTQEFIEYLNFLDQEENLDIIIDGESSIGNAVQIMTIHKSKGLEFPVVYLPELESSFSRANQGSDFFIDKEYGLIIPHIKDYIKTKNIMQYMYENNKKMRERSEAIRLLYVALTRAKEQFIFICSDKIEKPRDINTTSNFVQVLALVGDRLLANSRFQNLALEEQLIAFNPYTKKEIPKLETTKTVKYTYEELKIKTHEITTKKASHSIEKLPDIATIKNLKKGTQIHNRLQYCDFKHFIPTDDHEFNHIVANMLKYDIFTNYNNIYPEYEFFKDDIHGFIDCVLEFDDKYIIVDYKLNELDKDHYLTQIKVYKTYLEQIVNKPVEACLYSLLQDKFKYLNM